MLLDQTWEIKKKKESSWGRGEGRIRPDPVCRGRGSTGGSHWAIGFNKTHRTLHFSPTASEAAPAPLQGCARVAPGLRRAPASPGRPVLAPSLQQRLLALRFAHASHSRLDLTHSAFSTFPASTNFWRFVCFPAHVTVPPATWAPPRRTARASRCVQDRHRAVRRRVNQQNLRNFSFCPPRITDAWAPGGGRYQVTAN